MVGSGDGEDMVILVFQRKLMETKNMNQLIKIYILCKYISSMASIRSMATEWQLPFQEGDFEIFVRWRDIHWYKFIF